MSRKITKIDGFVVLSTVVSYGYLFDWFGGCCISFCALTIEANQNPSRINLLVACSVRRRVARLCRVCHVAREEQALSVHRGVLSAIAAIEAVPVDLRECAAVCPVIQCPLNR